MKYKLFCGLILMFVLLSSCRSTGGNTAEPERMNEPEHMSEPTSEIIIVCFNVATTEIELNGIHVGRIQERGSRIFQIPNGPILIHVRTASFHSNQRSGSISLNANNEHIVVNVRPGSQGIFLLEADARTPLFRPGQESPLAGAILNTFNTFVPLVPDGSRIAVLDITSDNMDTFFIQERLMVHFVNSQRFTVLDRQTLDFIREEQLFHESGEVSDETAVSIGQFLGADVVITGSVAENLPQRFLRSRAVDVRTAQVLAISLEEI